MASRTERIVLTYDDLARLPDDRQRYELFEGELQVTAAPNESHQAAVTNLVVIVGSHVRRRRLGRLYVAPFDVILDEADTAVVEPDLLFIAKERLSLIRPQYLRGAPDLVVEVLSPSTALRDLNAKMQLYARYGVPNYWIFDPDRRQVSAYVLSNSSYQLLRSARGEEEFSAPPFPDLVILLAEVWAPFPAGE